MSEQLQHKIIVYSVPPPPAAWEGIAARLDDDETYAMFSARVKQFEIAPPGNADNMFQQIERRDDATSIISRRRAIYRVAAAALIAGIVLITWAMFKTDVALTTKIANPIISSVGDKNHNSIGRDSTLTANNAGFIPDTSYQNSRFRSMKDSESFIGAAFNENVVRYALISNRKIFRPVSKVKAPPLSDKKDDLNITSNFFRMDSHYLLIEGPGGQLTRVSSKFKELIGLLNETDNAGDQQGEIMNESGNWKKRLAEWRNKISESSYIPASPNFLDIMALRDLIMEEQ